MTPTLLAIRAISVEFARRLFKTAAITTVVVLVALLALAFWLTTLSAWWWLLAVPVMGFSVLALALLFAAGQVIRKLTPAQRGADKARVKVFVDRLEAFSEVTQTAKVVLLYRVVSDIRRPREDGFIGSLSKDAGELRAEFQAIAASFK